LDNQHDMMDKNFQIIQYLPSKIEMIFFDFDGVFTNNEVIINEDGKESVKCNRSDGLGISMLHKLKIPMLIISTEKNPIVSQRAKKLKIPVKQGIQQKEKILLNIIKTQNLDPKNIIYIGNDVNDLECMKIVGVSVAPSDAHPSVLSCATIVLSSAGGKGAVRELVDYILEKLNNR
jgi:YrbI family 3-deoxy-D-manno-octulosonate 8-phosphate phosphatase